ncbi:MAG: polyprenyl synthetase family protein [Saprospiraceae bacterium]|nr:polyprenyl synthetase family protein [Saprospiraceae bacterium]
MTLTLDSIKKPIESELKEFEVIFRETMRSNVALLDRIMYYIAHRKGKQMRPMFVLLCAKIFGPINQSSYTAASLVELIHTATLVHDDVVDDAEKRRGFFSINALWKNKIAVLVGDYLLSKGLVVALDQEEFQILKIINEAVKQMSEGELLQMAKSRKLDIKEDVYYEIIEKKTASFIAAACKSGASTVINDSQILDKVGEIGLNIGMAFQIKDDLFDYGSGAIGKPTGIDVKEKKMTLPLIHALGKASRSEKRHIISLVKNHGHERNKVREVVNFAIEKGGMEYTIEKMNLYKNRALDLLVTLPSNESSQALESLIHFVTERNK